MLGEEFELGVLWDEYGIVGDVIVMFYYGLIYVNTYSLFHVFSHLHMIFHEQISMSFSHLIYFIN